MRALRALTLVLRGAAGTSVPEHAAMPVLDRREWGALAATILEHRIAVSVAKDVVAWGMPETLAAELAETARRQAMRSHWMLFELHRVLSALQQAEIPAVVLKGAALAHALGEPRFFLDLDVLVPISSLDRATEVLEPVGYAPVQTGRSNLYYERHHFHRVLRSQQGLLLELHWDMTRPSDYFHLDSEGVRARARSLPFHDISMSVPGHADQLLHAAEQSLREGFSEARRVLDVARLLRRGAADEAGLAQQAADCRLSSALWVLLVLTEALTGTGAPTLAREIAPASLRRASLQALDLPMILLERRAHALPGLTAWLWLLCAPNAAVTARTFGGIVFPGERGVLEDGHPPESAPGPVRRGILSLKRIGRAAKLAAYQTWKLGPHLTSRGTRHT